MSPFAAAGRELGLLDEADLRALAAHPAMNGLLPETIPVSRTRASSYHSWHAPACELQPCPAQVGPVVAKEIASFGDHRPAVVPRPRPALLTLCPNADAGTVSAFTLAQVGLRLRRAQQHLDPTQPEWHAALVAAHLLGAAPATSENLWPDLYDHAHPATAVTDLTAAYGPTALEPMIRWRTRLCERIEDLRSQMSPPPAGDEATWVVSQPRYLHDRSGNSARRDTLAVWLLNTPLHDLIRDRQSGTPWGLWQVSTVHASELTRRHAAFDAGPQPLTPQRLDVLRTAVTVYTRDPERSATNVSFSGRAWRASLALAAAAAA